MVARLDRIHEKAHGEQICRSTGNEPACDERLMNLSSTLAPIVLGRKPVSKLDLGVSFCLLIKVSLRNPISSRRSATSVLAIGESGRLPGKTLMPPTDADLP